MPPEELKKALATRALGKGITVLGEDAGLGERGGGLSFAGWGELIGGDAGCAGLFRDHQQTPVSYATVQLERRDLMNTRDLFFMELTESYATEAEARQIMTANEEAAGDCVSFKLRFTDDGSTADFVLIWTKRTIEGADYFGTTATGESSKGAPLRFESEEVRLGSEMMHLIVATSDEGPVRIAERQFISVVNAYRRANGSPAP
jgi:hypothetical protein